MEKLLDIKYNLPAIKSFLNIFDLTLEDKEEVVIGDILKVIVDNEDVGVVKFNYGEIEVKALSKYGIVKAQTGYADAFGLTDLESLDSIGKIGLYVSWFNNFMFSIDDKITGDLNFSVKLDNEFGNRTNLHAKLKIRDEDKKYTIIFQEEGYNLCYLEEGKDYQEKIVYDLFDSFTHSYIHHSINKKILDNDVEKRYYESAFIGKGYDNKGNNTAVNVKKIDNKLVDKKYLEFPKKGVDDEEAEVINKGEVFTSISLNTIDKINSLIKEFPFLEKIFIYSFNNFSNKEIYALFGLNKDKYTLDDFYFDKGKFWLKLYFKEKCYVSKRFKKDIRKI